MPGKQQFNTVLPPELIRRIKHHSIDAQLSLSDFVTRVFVAYLSSRETELADPASPAEPSPGLQLQPMVHVRDMAAAVTFYEKLGGQLLHGSRDGDWALMRIGGAEIGLLAHPPNPEQNEGQVELNFTSSQALDELEQQLRRDGIVIARSVTDEGFGRQLQLTSPDGLLIKVNQLEPELYT